MSFLYVKIYHGPCETFQNHTHKPQRLNGLKVILQRLGFRVDFVPVDLANYCMIEMCSHQVFRCNIKNLKFNMRYTRDEVCVRAIEAVLEASVKFRRARAYLWFWSLLDQQLLQRPDVGPLPFWPDELNFDDLESVFQDEECTECLDCCDLTINPEQKEENKLWSQV